MSTRIITVRSESDAAAAAAAGARALKAGQLVGFATETVYGIAAVASDASAMQRLRELKSRPRRPFSVHIGGPSDVGRYVNDVPGAAQRLIRKGWPGPVTLLLETGGRLVEEKFQKAGLHEVLASDGIIGLRCPDLPVTRAMLAAVDWPVVAPSANLAGEASPRTAEDVLASLQGKIDLLIDSGTTRYGTDSTIVQFTSGGWKVVRKGVYDERTIKRLTTLTLLFVCTGNTCRSPIAAGLARRMLAERMSCGVGDLRRKGIEVVSAGLYAADGQRATPEAIAAARRKGADISRHRSQKLTTELINSSDMVFCMTGFHADEVRRQAPAAADRVFRLDAKGDIPDPIGGGLEAYRGVAERIDKALRACLDKVSL